MQSFRSILSSPHASQTNAIDLGNSATLTSTLQESTSRIVNDDQDPPGSAKSRSRKVERACDACRRRKTKCDGPKKSGKVCSNCMQGRKACTYVEDSKPRGPPKAYITGLEDRVEELEALLKKLYPDSDFSAELGAPVIRGSWKLDSPSQDSFPLTEYKPSRSSRGVSRTRSFSPISPTDTGGPQASSSGYHSLAPLSRASSAYLSSPIELASQLKRPRSLKTTRAAPHVPTDTDSTGEQYSDHEDSAELAADGDLKPLTLSDYQSLDNYTQMRFHGSSSSLKLIAAARRLKQQHMTELIHTQSGSFDAHRGLSICTSGKQPSTRPMQRPQFWTTPSWELAWEGTHINSLDILAKVLYSFPPEDLALELTDLYFINSNCFYPLLHRPTFIRQWKEGLHRHDIWFACLCLSLFAVASRWSDDPRVLPSDVGESDHLSRFHRAGWKYFDPCLDIHRARTSLIHPAGLFEVQTLCLIAIFLKATPCHPSGWVLIGFGLRKAQDVGAHRKKVYSDVPNVNEELWKRAFWMLLSFDRAYSCTLGRAAAIGEGDFDVELPLEVDDEYWEPGDSTQAFKQPRGKPSTISCFVSWIKIIQILAYAMRTVYAIDKSKCLLGLLMPRWRENVLKQLDTALTEWVDSIPEHLKWTNEIKDPIFSDQSATLFATYTINKTVIFKPFFSPPSVKTDHQWSSYPHSHENPPLAATDICIELLTTCASYVDSLLRRATTLTNLPNLISLAHYSAATLLEILWSHKAHERSQIDGQVNEIKPRSLVETEKLMEAVHVYVRVLELTAPHWEIASYFLEQVRKSLPNEGVVASSTKNSSEESVSQHPTSFDRFGGPGSSNYAKSSKGKGREHVDAEGLDWCPTTKITSQTIPGEASGLKNGWKSNQAFHDYLSGPYRITESHPTSYSYTKADNRWPSRAPSHATSPHYDLGQRPGEPPSLSVPVVDARSTGHGTGHPISTPYAVHRSPSDWDGASSRMSPKALPVSMNIPLAASLHWSSYNHPRPR